MKIRRNDRRTFRLFFRRLRNVHQMCCNHCKKEREFLGERGASITRSDSFVRMREDSNGSNVSSAFVKPVSSGVLKKTRLNCNF